jgi:hypothetical protein
MNIPGNGRERAIVISALPRGGSNILWNVIASHPAVCLPRYEVKEIIEQLGIAGKLIRKGFGERPVIGGILRRRFKRRAYDLKVACLHDEDQGQAAPDRRYQQADIEDTIICLKCLTEDLALSSFLACIYAQCHFIGLVRNGFAFCDGVVRRGGSAEDAARLYSSTVNQILSQAETFEHFEVVRFEDVLRDPFAVSEKLFRFLELEPNTLDHLRLKAKGKRGADGDYGVGFGEVDRHYWFDREKIVSALDPEIDKRQSDCLSESDRRAFKRIAETELARLGYVE